jgi:hypothetical protein
MLKKNPLVFRNEEIFIKLNLFTLDAPARCAVLQTHYYNSVKGCSRCDINGIYRKNRMCFPGIVGNPRTNASFRDKNDTAYHLGISILEEIEDIDLVNDFVLDYLHVVLLGAFRKWLNLLFGIRGIYPIDVIKKISAKFMSFNESIPPEFQRPIRPLEKLKCYHGHELRAILLYAGMVALKDEIRDCDYQEFLLLQNAISILIDSELCKIDRYLNLAEKLLEKFVLDFGELYGTHFISHNIHSLLHITQDVR